MNSFKNSLLIPTFLRWVLVFFLSITQYWSQPGTLDNSFGMGGIVTTTIHSTVNQATDFILKPDGKIVVIGYCGFGTNSVVLVSYNSDGTIDSSFGTNGVFTNTNSTHDRTIKLQQDGKMVSTGDWYVSLGVYNVSTSRYLPNGNLDPNFGINGVVTTSVNGANDAGRSLVLQPDGKIIIAGEGIFSPNNSLFLLR